MPVFILLHHAETLQLMERPRRNSLTINKYKHLTHTSGPCHNKCQSSLFSFHVRRPNGLCTQAGNYLHIARQDARIYTEDLILMVKVFLDAQMFGLVVICGLWEASIYILGFS